jgi:hypothetical protein
MHHAPIHTHLFGKDMVFALILQHRPFRRDGRALAFRFGSQALPAGLRFAPDMAGRNTPVAYTLKHLHHLPVREQPTQPHYLFGQLFTILTGA